MTKGLILLAVSILVSSVALFSVQNAGAASVQFLVWTSISMPVGFILALSFAGGLLLSGVLAVGWQLTSGQSPIKTSATHASRTPNEANRWE